MTAAASRALDPIELLDALGIGWGVHELYPNPVTQAAFVSAVDRLAVLKNQSLTFEIGAGTVSCDGEELTISRGGTTRLSLRLFVHEVEWLEIIGQPSAHDLNEFFRLLAADEHEIRSSGGISQALQEKDVWSLSVTQRGLLADALENPWEEREGEEEADAGDTAHRASRLARMVTGGASAQDVAEALVEEAGGDTEQIAETFCDTFRTVYPADQPTGASVESVSELLAVYRQAPKTRPPVDTFAEAFFLIPVGAQARILSDFLANRTEGLHSLLLDQFAGIELAELAPLLTEETFTELLGYARDVVDTETGSADELLPLVSAARDVKVARRSAADRIREMIEGIGGLGGATGGLAGQLRTEITGGQALGRYVLRILMEIEDRPDRFARFVGSWTGLISRAIADGDLDRAFELLEAGTVDLKLSVSKRRVVEAELVELLRADFAVFHSAAQDVDNREALGRLLGGFGEPAAAHLMERLTVEEDPAARRTLISLLVVVGTDYSRPIVQFFADSRWYVVRNAVTIAGKIGGEMWIEHLLPLLDHSDHRVVVEALRALTPLAPDAAVPGLVKSLAHDHERVRETGFLLLKGSTSRLCQAELARALTDRAMDGARTEIAELLYGIGSADAVGVLQQIARKPFLISSTRRDARRAAREVLGRAA
ncbi:MAG: HEAT repeat domain-containing protein [Acidimicrobiia bacterium]|nr:HEAT repeat domain-containing protein [Acidimicrobiia bacterium]